MEDKLKIMTDAVVDFIGTRDVKDLKSMRDGYAQLAEVSDDSGEPSHYMYDDLIRLVKLIDNLILVLKKDPINPS